MAKAIVDSLDGIPEALRSEYRPGTKEEGLDGKFVLKVEPVGGWGLEPVTALKNSLSNAKTERDAAKKILKELGDDFSVDSYRQAMSELESLKKGSTSESAKAEIESIKKQLSAKHQSELAERDRLLGERDTEINELLIDAEATRAINELEGKTKLLLPVVRQNAMVIRVERKGPDGKTRLVPKAIIRQQDGAGARLSSKPGSQDEMGIREFVETLKASDDYAPAFAGSGASGTVKGQGSPNGTQKPGGTSNGGAGGDNVSAVDRLREQRRAAGAGVQK